MRTVIPIFPLDYVLLPGLPLPLHIFEPRYRQLIADVAAPGETAAFGVVLGSSVAADALHAASGPTATPSRSQHSVAEIGTLAEILENEPYPDGRCDLLTVGSRRFRIHSVDDSSKPYLQADIEYLDEVDGSLDAGVLGRARALSLRYGQVLQELTGANTTEDLATDPLRASYEIAARLQLSTGERQSLLAAADSAERLAAEVGLLRRELAILRDTRSVPVPAQALRVATSAN